MCRCDAWYQDPEVDDRKKALSPAHRRELAQEATSEHGCSQCQICRVFGLHRSTYRYQAKRPSDARQQAGQAAVEPSLEHPELGSDKVGQLVRKGAGSRQGMVKAIQAVAACRRTLVL